jgi:hypothetical protein
MKLKTTMPRVIIRLSKYDESRNRKNAIMRMDQAHVCVATLFHLFEKIKMLLMPSSFKQQQASLAKIF